MGIEQGTPVTGSTIDLLRNIDLPDLRLPRAFQAWTEFKTRHEPQVAAIGTLPLDQVVALGNELSVLIGQAIGMEAIDQSKHIDEPLENPIHIGTYLMAKRARELGIKSILTGDGSDEFFLGYERIACWLNGSSSNPNATYLKLLSTMQPDEAAELYKDDAVALTEPIVDSFNRPIEPFRDIDQVLLFERLDHLSEYHNMRIDRMTMAHGVEARVPFEDHRLVEFSLHIPITTLFGTSAKEWLGQLQDHGFRVR